VNDWGHKFDGKISRSFVMYQIWKQTSLQEPGRSNDKNIDITI